MRDERVVVAVPVAVDTDFTYAVPPDWDAAPRAGERVLVPFGRRTLVGVVRPNGVGGAEPERIKPIAERLDPEGRPALPQDLVELCEWMQDYYLAPPGEVYRLTLPGLLTNADARTITITDAGRRALGGPLLGGPGSALSGPERRLLESVGGAGAKGLAVARLGSLRPRIPSALRHVEALAERELLEVGWADQATRKAREEPHYRRTDLLRAPDEEVELQRLLGRSKLRRALLDHLETLPREDWVGLSELRGPFRAPKRLLGPLVEQGLVAEQMRLRELDPFDATRPESTTPQAPTTDQAKALDAMHALLDERRFESVLLHGITGSGKTEVYLQVIGRAIEQGGGAIVLVPEIALTPQLSDRFRARFGEKVAVLHSGLTPRQRLDAWEHIRSGARPIVIGPRSAIFAPLPDLRVIVVDEEHDPSFKQEDGVRYNARDVSLVRGRASGALVILGSATPSLETYQLATQGRHRWLRLTTRPTPRPLPTVEVVDLRTHRAHPDTLLTAVLKERVLETVQAGEQSILFLNRRGFTTTLVCEACGNLQQCPDCSAPSMTYHLHRNRLVCHLCGHIESAPEHCRSCGEGPLTQGGAGTERIEVALAAELGGVRVLRLDRDTSRGRRLLETLARFRDREADVLVGTQMLSKGHDFPGVTLVGILQADQGLALPDPRAAERAFQLLTQVAGRAGRGDRPGRVVVQAYAIDHPAIDFASRHDYEGFAAQELEARRELGNPPFGHLAAVRFSGLDPARVHKRAEAVAGALRRAAEAVAVKHPGEEPPVMLLGPAPAPIERINRRTRWQLLIRGRQRPALRWVLRSCRGLFGAEGSGSSQTLAIADVDPQALL